MCRGSSLGSFWTEGGTKMYNDMTKNADVARQYASVWGGAMLDLWLQEFMVGDVMMMAVARAL
jgi:hypothetical protein